MTNVVIARQGRGQTVRVFFEERPEVDNHPLAGLGLDQNGKRVCILEACGRAGVESGDATQPQRRQR